MNFVAKTLAGGVVAVALMSAAPAAAQYYPGNPGYGYQGYGGGNVVGQIFNQVFGGYGYNGYGPNTRIAAQQCAAVVQQRIGGYGGQGYGGYGQGYGGYGQGYGGYGQGYGGYGQGYGGGRVLAITHADIHSGGIIKVKGVATSGMNGGYGGYGTQTADLKFRCDIDYRGAIRYLNVERNYDVDGYSRNYTPYGNDYSQYGYHRY